MAFDELEWVRVEAEFLELGGGDIWDRVENAAWVDRQLHLRENMLRRRAQRATVSGRDAVRKYMRGWYAEAKTRPVAVRCCPVCRRMFTVSQAKRRDGSRHCSKSCGRTFGSLKHGNVRLSAWHPVKGKVSSLRALAAEQGLSYTTVRERILDRGMTPEQALAAPKRTAQTATIGGETRSVADWAKHFGVPYLRVWKRMQKGWPVEKALKTPGRGAS